MIERPSPDFMLELSRLRRKLHEMSIQVSGADKRTQAANVRADRAEQAERQLSADRDRWKRLALQHEAQLRSLMPQRAS
jgi:hypothetical protein